MSQALLPTYIRTPLRFTKGRGAWLTDEAGDEYLDFGAGIAVNAFGHAHPTLVEALKSQADRIWHSSNLYQVPGQERLAERLVGTSFADRAFFTNSGAEAVEACIKTARKYHSHNGQPERWRIITFEGAFHGRTLATIAAAGSPKMVDGFGPMPGGFDIVAFDDLEAVKEAIGPETAAILLEPIQGEGGIRPFAPETLRELRRLCDQHGLLLIFDEVQCGMGRTGHLFVHQAVGVTPDAMALAKGIGGGFPLGACLATARAASGMGAGTHGSTYGGNPLAMAVGNAVLDLMLAEGFLDEVRRKGGLFRQALGRLQDAHPDLIAEIRGAGLMLGVACKMDVKPVIDQCRKQRLLAVPAAAGTVRLLPPLNASDDEIRLGCAKLEQAFAALAAEGAA